MKNVKEITKEFKGEVWEKYLDKAWNKIKKDVKLDGFRKGNVPKDAFIKKNGIESLFMDAYNFAIDETFADVIKESKMNIVVEPAISIESISKDSLVVKYTLISKPDVKLGNYKKLGVKKDEVKVTSKDIDQEIEHIRSHMAEVVTKKSGKVEKGDTAVLDFEGTIDGKVIDGGVGTDYPLEIGSNTFIPGFEDGVIGMKVNETKELKLKFPDDYVEELKGKDVTFKVTIKEIKTRVLPELNKDFFEDLGEKDIKTEEEFKKHIKEQLTKNKEMEADNKFVEELVNKAIDNLEVDINQEIIDYEVQILMHNFNHQLEHQGMNIDKYLSYTGLTKESMIEQFTPDAIKRLKTRYLLEELMVTEKIEVDDKEAKKEAEEEAKRYGMSVDDFLKEIGGIEAMKFELKARKAVEILKNNN